MGKASTIWHVCCLSEWVVAKRNRFDSQLATLLENGSYVGTPEIAGVQGFFVAPHLANLARSDKLIVNVTQTDSWPKCGLIGQKKQKNDGLGRIRTGDLRHVKAGDLARSVAFSWFAGLLSEGVDADETTTRKASAPLYTVW
jgi:hypothetical protein